MLEGDLEYPAELHEEHTEQLSPGIGEKGRERGMYVGLPKEFDTLGQKQLCHALQELAVLSERGYKTEARAQGAGVRSRTLDGAVDPDEYRIQQKRKEQR